MPAKELILHDVVQRAIRSIIKRPVHAILITGLSGSGKSELGRRLAAQLLRIEPDNLELYPYIKTIAPIDGKAIPIESIRELQHFLALKIPGAPGISRVVIIEDAQLLTTEAQNALLKMLEEPPADTVLLLTAVSTEALLPTIQSRVRVLQALSPGPDKLKLHFASDGYSAANIDKALMLSGGLPGLTYALLAEDTSHPLFEATVQARKLLQASAYERLAAVDALSKDKQLSQNVTFILGEMSRMALARSASGSNTGSAGAASTRWSRILRASYEAQQQLRTNVQTKLILINLMLAM
jgi:hypothetical protein